MPNLPFDPFCLSSYLAFRYVVESGRGWCAGVVPTWPVHQESEAMAVSNADEIIEALQKTIARDVPSDGGILLSGGIDSAILAALLPRGVPAYTIRFVADGAIDESSQAAVYAAALGLDHTIIDVTWDDHLESIDALCRSKRAPLHAAEIGIFTAARLAREEGVGALVVGNGADSRFGGLDKLLAEDWTFDAFVQRYSFLNPRDWLVDPVDMVPPFEPYRRGAHIDYTAFLETVHGIGITQAFFNAIETAGCKMVEPYENLVLSAPLDLHRIRNGESKYLLREVFSRLYPDMAPPEKIPFARPMDQWLRSWPGCTRPEFKQDANWTSLSGDQRWQLYCLERFLNTIEAQ